MATAETAKLVASLELKDNMSKGIGSANRSLKGLSSSIAHSRAVAVGLGVGLERVAEKGISALGNAIGDGIAAAQELERAQAQTQAVITSTGNAAGVTAQQVRDMANSLEDVTTVDDKTIQQGENLLLTFTKVGKTVFPEATRAAVNMAIAFNKGDAATADIDKAAIQLGKALNDPAKGYTALKRSGVSFSEAQIKILKGTDSLNKEETKHYNQLKQSNKAAAERYKRGVLNNKLLASQKLILGELNTEFGKAGEAAGKGFAADMNRAQDAIEDAKIALAQGLMPAVGEVARTLSSVLKDPQVLAGIKTLGTKIGDAISGIVAFVKTVDWTSIGTGIQSVFSTIGSIVSGISSAWAAVPDPLKELLITGIVADRTMKFVFGFSPIKFATDTIGGAVEKAVAGGLASAGLGKFFVQPVFVTNMGVGGMGGPGGIGGVAGKGLSGVAKVALVGEAIGLTAAVIGTQQEISAASTAQAQAINNQTTEFVASQPNKQQLTTALAGVDKGIADLTSNPLNVLVQGDALNQLREMRSKIVGALGGTQQDASDRRDKDAGPNASKETTKKVEDVKRSVEALAGKTADDLAGVHRAVDDMKGRLADDVVNVKQATDTSGNKAQQAGYTAARASASAGAAIVSAIYANRPIINNNVNISATTVSQTIDVDERYGKGGSDRVMNNREKI